MTPEKKQDEKRLNPQITTTEIGVRDLREITIYPLSMADQLNLTDLITQALNAFFQQQDEESIAFVAFMIELIKQNMNRIVAMITDVKKDEDLLVDITNFQASEIAKIVYEVNYESAAKNLESLFEKVRGLFRSERLSQPFVNDIPSTDLKTSTEKDGEKEESQLDS